jgi:hypothetical protein
LLPSFGINRLPFSLLSSQGEGGGLPRVPPSKEFENLDHKNAIKQVNRGPPPRFSHNPKYPPQKHLKMTVYATNSMPHPKTIQSDNKEE